MDYITPEYCTLCALWYGEVCWPACSSWSSSSHDVYFQLFADVFALWSAPLNWRALSRGTWFDWWQFLNVHISSAAFVCDHSRCCFSATSTCFLVLQLFFNLQQNKHTTLDHLSVHTFIPGCVFDCVFSEPESFAVLCIFLFVGAKNRHKQACNDVHSLSALRGRLGGCNENKTSSYDDTQMINTYLYELKIRAHY